MKKIARFVAASVCLCFSVGASAEVSPAELELTRTYFAMGAMATSDSFECFGDEQVNKINQQLDRVREMASDSDDSVGLMVSQGTRLISRYVDLLSCADVLAITTRLQTIESQTDPEISEYMGLIFGREILIGMINAASIEAKMMNNLAYGDAAILSGDVNDLLYELARDQIEFSLLLLNDFDIGVDSQYLYKHMLERGDELDNPVETDDKIFAAIRPSVGRIYRKMGMVLLDLDTKGDEANQIEALFDYALDTNSHLYRVNSTILNSFPSGI